MPKTKISEFSATPANNTDIDSINIAEGCAPSGINDAIRELMAQLKDFQTGAVGDSFNGPVGTTTAAAGAFTTLSASSTATLSGLTASTALALDASKNIVSVTNTGTGSNVLATSPTLVTPILGTPTSATLTNATGLPIATGVSGLGTGVATFLATPSSANLAAALTDETGSGANVFATSPTLVTPILGTPTSATLTNATGLPISTGVSGLGTGIATALAVNTGSAGAPVLFNGALGTPSGGTLTSVTGLPLTTGVTGTLPTANGGTNLGGATPFTSGGVVYASSSSALATGSALTFNGTTVGINTTIGNSTSLSITGDYTSNNVATFIGVQRTGGAIAGAWSYSDLLGSIQFGTTTNHTLVFLQNNAEAMRLTSTGLGIGTTSPAYKLQVVGGAISASRARSNTAGDMALQIAPSDTTVQYGFRVDSNNNNLNLDYYSGSAYTTRAVLDASGNLGLGVTPAAWNSSYRAFQVADHISLWGNSGGGGALILANNEVFDASNTRKYLVTDFATEYVQVSGQHQWKTAPSGTAGNVITFTQAMTLDASSNLVIGDTTAGAKLSVVKAITGGNIGTSFQQELVNNNSANVGDWTGTVYRWLTGNANSNQAYIGAIVTTNAGDTKSDLVFGVKNSNVGNTIVEAMRIQTGNVGIGTSSPAFKADVKVGSNGSGIVTALRLMNEGTSGGDGAKILFTAGTSTDGAGIGSGGVALNSADLRFFTGGNTERMRINAGAPILCLAGGSTTATGTGIAFPATQSASSDANTLDDYEEGTFAPTVTFGGNSVGVTYNTTFTGATYTKIGNRVCVSGYILLTNKGSSTGDAGISNLPFTSEAGTTKYLGASVGGLGFTFANQFWSRIAPTSTTIDLFETTEAGVATAITNSDFTNDAQLYFSATYTF